MKFTTLKRLALRSIYPLAPVAWFVLRPRSVASACVVRHGGRVLLVRHTYGRRDEWAIPGGLARPGEDPALAAARELREETGLSVGSMRRLWREELPSRHRHLTVHMFAADAESDMLEVDAVEIAEAGWFRPEALPGTLRRRTQEAVALAFGAGTSDPVG